MMRFSMSFRFYRDLLILQHIFYQGVLGYFEVFKYSHAFNEILPTHMMILYKSPMRLLFFS
jgi:hypothetical protein